MTNFYQFKEAITLKVDFPEKKCFWAKFNIYIVKFL